MNSPQLQQQYPLSYATMQPIYTQAQQNMQLCGNMTYMYPIQQPVHPLSQPQQFNPYLVQCSYLLPPAFCGHGHSFMYQYPQQQQLQPSALPFFNQVPYAPPTPGLVTIPAATQPMPPLPQPMMPVQAQPLNSACNAQLQPQSIYPLSQPVMPQTPANSNVLPNPLESSASANTAAKPDEGEESKKHVFLRGALYNTDFLKSPTQQDSSNSLPLKNDKLQANVTDEDPYDPMDEVSSSRV